MVQTTIIPNNVVYNNSFSKRLRNVLVVLHNTQLSVNGKCKYRYSKRKNSLKTANYHFFTILYWLTSTGSILALSIDRKLRMINSNLLCITCWRRRPVRLLLSDRSSRQLISAWAIKMAFSTVSFSVMSAMSSTEGNGSYVAEFPSFRSAVETSPGESTCAWMS